MRRRGVKSSVNGIGSEKCQTMPHPRLLLTAPLMQAQAEIARTRPGFDSRPQVSLFLTLVHHDRRLCGRLGYRLGCILIHPHGIAPGAVRGGLLGALAETRHHLFPRYTCLTW